MKQAAAYVHFGFGQTQHARAYPVVNTFTVGTVFVRLHMRALAALPAQRVGLFGVNRAALLGFRDCDHGTRNPAHGSALAWVDDLLRSQGITDCTGDMWLHTFPSVLGYAFKPVSFWFCHRENGELGAVLAEVHNTFGEQHCYLLHHADGAPLRNGQHIVAKKMFHVSPFFPVRGEYRFTWMLLPERSVLRIAYYDAAHVPNHPDDITLSTSISGQHAALTVTTCLRALLSYPAQAFTVLARIHWQAFKLWVSGVRFYKKPALPTQSVTHNTPF